MIRIELLGSPQGRGRARFTRAGFAYTPQKTRTYDENLGAAAGRAMNGQPPLTGPLEVFFLAVFPIPESWSKKKRAAALSGQLRPTVKPDGDNILKQCDSMNGIAFVDDKQIVDARVKKIYGERPRLVVEITTVEPLLAGPIAHTIPIAPWSEQLL